MTENLLSQLLVSIIPSVIAGVVSLLISIKKCKSDIKALETKNEHEIEKLMKQHEINIELKEKEHQMKIEELKIQNEQEILKKEKELSDSAVYSITQGFANSLVAEILDSKEIKDEISKKIMQGINKK